MSSDKFKSDVHELNVFAPRGEIVIFWIRFLDNGLACASSLITPSPFKMRVTQWNRHLSEMGSDLVVLVFAFFQKVEWDYEDEYGDDFDRVIFPIPCWPVAEKSFNMFKFRNFVFFYSWGHHEFVFCWFRGFSILILNNFLIQSFVLIWFIKKS